MASRQLPWTRILVEGVVIVGSILLAFGIDAWWEGRSEAQAEQDVLVSLEADFTRNRDEALSVVDYHLRRFEQSARFESMTEQEVLAISADSARWTYIALMGPVTFEPDRATVDALVGAGDLDVLEDRALREDLSQFLNRFDSSERAAERLLRSAEAVWEATIPHGGPWRDSGELNPLDPMTAGKLLELREDDHLMGLSRMNHHFASQYAVELRVLARLSEQILERTRISIR